MGPLEKRRAEDRGIAQAQRAVRDQIMGDRQYTGQPLGDTRGLFGGSSTALDNFRRNVKLTTDDKNWTTTGGVDNLQKLDLSGALPSAQPTSAADAEAWTKGMAAGLGITSPEDTRASMMNAAKKNINFGAQQARVGDAQQMQASGMDDSGMALALNQQRTLGVGRDMANARQAINADYANRMEGYRNQLLGSAQNYAQHADQYGLNRGQMDMSARGAEYQQNVWDPYQMKTGYLMGDAANQQQAAASRRAGNMQMVGGLLQGGMQAGATLGSAGMNLAASKSAQAAQGAAVK